MGGWAGRGSFLQSYMISGVVTHRPAGEKAETQRPRPRPGRGFAGDLAGLGGSTGVLSRGAPA